MAAIIEPPLIMYVDDDPNFRGLVTTILTDAGFRVSQAESGIKALELLQEIRPDLIVLDVMMPEMTGHQVYVRLQENKEFAGIPIIFLSGTEEEKNKSMALALGAAGYLTKPVKGEDLKAKVSEQLKERLLWNNLDPDKFPQFRDYLFDDLQISSELRSQFQNITPGQIYFIAESLKVAQSQIAACIARFFGLQFVSKVRPEMWLPAIIAPKFSRQHLIVPVNDYALGGTFAMSNPFDVKALEMLNTQISTPYAAFKVAIIEPKNIQLILEKIDKAPEVMSLPDKFLKASVAEIGVHILERAVEQKSSDIHIEPKGQHTIVRFRSHGEMRDLYTLANDTGAMLISRLKALAGLDIVDRRKPQDGAMETEIAGRAFVLRLATTSTPQGESMTIRLLEPWASPKSLIELGMAEKQINYMLEFAHHTRGMILIVGPTGGGKTTTTYSLLSQIDYTTRSLMSVEDPVEYRIPRANQQQVDVKAGVTFEALLKSSVRQDPDILFIGEIRDPPSAKIAVDFASTGHLAISTMHTSNATTAIFRMERLEVPREVIADSVLGIVAQRLLKRLCPHCKKVVPISKEEKEWMGPFMKELPTRVAHPIGCPPCGNTGYLDREAVYEIIKFDPPVQELVRKNASIQEIRDFVAKRGDFLMSQHALEKVKQLLFAPKDVYENLLLEESEQKIKSPEGAKPAPAPAAANGVAAAAAAQGPGAPAAVSSALIGAPPPGTSPAIITDDIPAQDVIGKQPTILVVEDDYLTQTLIKSILDCNGFTVTTASDGVEALMCLGKDKYDLIISDIMMPNLDGFKLLELKTSKGIKTPIIFLTAMMGDENELKGLSMGADDYIKKPIRREIFLSRIRRVLQKAQVGR